MQNERIEIPIKISMRGDGPMQAKFGNVQMVHTDNYEDLYNKPKINDIELIGNKTGAQLKLQHQMREVSASEIDDIIFGGM